MWPNRFHLRRAFYFLSILRPTDKKSASKVTWTRCARIYMFSSWQTRTPTGNVHRKNDGTWETSTKDVTCANRGSCNRVMELNDSFGALLLRWFRRKSSHSGDVSDVEWLHFCYRACWWHRLAGHFSWDVPSGTDVAASSLLLCFFFFFCVFTVFFLPSHPAYPMTSSAVVLTSAESLLMMCFHTISLWDSLRTISMCFEIHMGAILWSSVGVCLSSSLS